MADEDVKVQEFETKFDRKTLTDMTNSVLDTITSPDFLKKMHEARFNAERGGSLEDMANLMSVENLRNEGVALPDQFRVTSRKFEDLTTGESIEINQPVSERKMDAEEPVALGGCAGGGAFTVCACGGYTETESPQ